MWETLAETVDEASELETRALPLQWTPLQHAARHGSVEDVKQLLDLGAEIQTKDVHGATPLHNAVRSGDAVKVEALVVAGASLDVPDRYGQTALHVAASCEQPAVARSLVLLGANIHAKDGPLHDGETPAMVAARFGATEVIDVLDKYARRRLKMAGGRTELVPAASIFLKNAPPPFSPKRMRVPSMDEIK